ncbi:MAG: hypothetical protein AAFX79_12560 [Planctomycetota bacterium]
MASALIIADAGFASRERDMLARLEVGLAAEGARVVHAVPGTLPELLDGRVFSTAIAYEPHGPLPPFGVRAENLAERALEATARIGVVHAFGSAAWRLAIATSRLLESVLVLEVCSAAQADALAEPAVRTALRDREMVASVPGTGLEHRCLAHNLAMPLRLIRWGVHSEAMRRGTLAGGDRPAVLLAGPGRERAAWHAAVRCIASTEAPGGARPLLLIDADAAEHVHLHPLLDELDLGEHASLVPGVEARREPALHADLLVLPDAAGEHRSLALDALARGMIVTTAGDPLIDELGESYGVVPFEPAHPTELAATLAALWDGAPAIEDLRARGRDAIGRRHMASRHVAGVLELHASLAGDRSA